ncbi:hypothetical protein [Pseudoxanthomonas winnipegensis]|uniref:hypothetical protein n=1 Tax=Pseudoxanthomonas winnipegensis TaxID=2480810 RepID=UPI00103B471B|nr:hypothetical protein [Pseudoxanthomonas winnipegensis]TBV72243.1 hypothetical protein EYC45_15715 [Pseudoxanthomonas winnipegensis]
MVDALQGIAERYEARMVIIRQHGKNGELFDMASFFGAIDRFAKPETWLVVVDQCVGGNALEIENRTAGGLSMSDPVFQNMYRDIHQTIDGHFVGLAGGERVFELRAVDSSFWEVTGSPAFESHMLQTYGAG